MKPARIPLELPAKYLNPIYFLLVIVVWYLPLYGMLLLDLPDGLLLGLAITWVLLVFGLMFFPCCYYLILQPEEVQICLFGKVIQRIPASGLQYIYSAGTFRTTYLCLSALTPEELAQLREKKLQKGFFSRQDLPAIKNSANWQLKLAREYLIKPDWKISNLHTATPILWMPFDPVIAIFLRRLYPQLPCMDLRTYPGSPSAYPPDQIPFHSERYRADETGIHILSTVRREELRCFPAAQIKTIFRLDRFVQLSKVEPAYASYLVVSELSVAELAERGKRKGRQKWKKQLISQLPEADELYAAEFHFSGLPTWNVRTSTDCHMEYTPQTEALLRRLYPHAQWIDYSAKWQY